MEKASAFQAREVRRWGRGGKWSPPPSELLLAHHCPQGEAQTPDLGLRGLEGGGLCPPVLLPLPCWPTHFSDLPGSVLSLNATPLFLTQSSLAFLSKLLFILRLSSSVPCTPPTQPLNPPLFPWSSNLNALPHPGLHPQRSTVDLTSLRAACVPRMGGA